MRVVIAAVGKAKASAPEQLLYHHYLKRIPWKITCTEVEAKPGPQQKAKEGELLLAACKGQSRIIALDESGALATSSQIAQHIAGWQQQGDSSFAFIIGGADGLDTAALKKVHAVWSFGRVTWPHMLVRALLAEQLYRAYSILQNHPYHRQ